MLLDQQKRQSYIRDHVCVFVGIKNRELYVKVGKTRKLLGMSITCEHEFHALNSSPVKTMGGIKNGKPTTLEQNNISICA
jgi:hypothetical protein